MIHLEFNEGRREELLPESRGGADRDAARHRLRIVLQLLKHLMMELQDFGGVAIELRPVGRELHRALLAVKEGDPELVLELPDGPESVACLRIQRVARRLNASGADDFTEYVKVFKILRFLHKGVL